MKIAIVFKDNEVCQNYGKSEGFIFYELDYNKNIISNKKIYNSGIKGCEMADLFKHYNVDTVIVGGIGINAKNRLIDSGINIIVGASGNIDKVINDLFRITYQKKDAN